MGWIQDIKLYQADRDALIALRYDLEEIDEAFRKRTAGLKSHEDEYQHRLGEYFDELDYSRAEIAQIETKQMRRRTARWRIPLPQRPKKFEEKDEFWDWHAPHGQHYLSEKAMSHLRREIHTEWEMWWKPWLSWFAIIASFLSLAISIFKS